MFADIRFLTPSPRTLLTVGLSGLLGGAVAIGVSGWFDGKTPTPPDRDPHFVEVGRAYLPGLGRAYAAAWEEGAKSLDCGRPLSAAIADVGRAWDVNRAQLFDRAAAPEFARIVPGSQDDADLTPGQRRAMVSAWRGFAAGLGFAEGPGR